MKTMIRNVPFTLILLFTGAAYGIPLMNVTVSDGNSKKLAFQGATNSNGTFSTADLRPGQYVVRFNSKSAAVNGDEYMLILFAGNKPLISNGVAGERFAAGGVAVRMDVKNPAKMTGQIESMRALNRDNVKVINGMRYFFVRGQIGSNLGGRWIEESSLRRSNVSSISLDSFRDMQERSNRGTMNVHEFGPGNR